MSNIFHYMRNNKMFSESYLAILIFLSALAMLLIGINHFVEDTYSSYMGLQMLEKELGLIPASWTLTYWTMSIAPQIAQIIFAYMFMSDTKKFKWAFWGAILFFFVDFAADIWYRGDARIFHDWKVFFATLLLTTVYFTIGSEIFMSAGFGITMTMLKPFIIQMKSVLIDITEAFGSENKSAPSMKSTNQAQPGMLKCPKCGVLVQDRNMREHFAKCKKGGNPAPSGKPFPNQFPVA